MNENKCWAQRSIIQSSRVAPSRIHVVCVIMQWLRKYLCVRAQSIELLRHSLWQKSETDENCSISKCQMKNCFLVNSISLWRLHLAIESAASQSLYFITCKSLWTNSYRVENEFSSQPEVNGEEKDEFATPWNLCRVSIFSTTDRNLPWSKTFPWNVVGKSLHFVLRQATRLLYCFWSFLLIEIFLKILLTAVVQITTFHFRYTDMVFNNRLDFVGHHFSYLFVSMNTVLLLSVRGKPCRHIDYSVISEYVPLPYVWIYVHALLSTSKSFVSHWAVGSPTDTRFVRLCHAPNCLALYRIDAIA